MSFSQAISLRFDHRAICYRSSTNRLIQMSEQINYISYILYPITICALQHTLTSHTDNVNASLPIL